MELRKNWYYYLISLTVAMLFLLGGWWLYLVFKLANKLSELNDPTLQGNLVSMVKWEGFTFIFLLLVLTSALVYIYLLDHKKTKALQAFFASLTHELKTPLASMRLQSEILNDTIENASLSDQSRKEITTYTNRLISDSIKLEDQLDNHLQLSRVERGSALNLRVLDLHEFTQREIERNYLLKPFIKIESISETSVMADDYALQTIIRNLMENTLLHNKNVEKVHITIKSIGSSLVFTYDDQGPQFAGEANKLGKLFYKHDSPQGSGIGLYLIKKLMRQMGGDFQIKSSPNLTFHLHFRRSS